MGTKVASPPVRAAVDYLVLGAGSAGSVLANRLSAASGSAKYSVAIVEAGKSDVGRWDSWTVQMPAALTYSVADKRYNWDFYSVPQAGLNNRQVHEPRGKVLGGSSSINAMVYARGHPLDFERWEREGAKGWGYKHCLPYFRRAQNFIGSKGSNSSPNLYRGSNGPLRVTSYETEDSRTNVLFNVLERAGEEAGYPITKDNNGYQQEGFGPFDMTIDADTGKRCSAAAAYLHPALKDTSRDLQLFTETTVRRIIFDDGQGGIRPRRALGVECEDNKGQRFELRANKEVILSMGAVGSPQTLMLSGVGDTEELKKAGIHDVVHHNPEVGANLQDHLEVYLQYLCSQPVSLYPVASWTMRFFHRRAAAGLEWFLRGTGICASNQFETGAFIRSDASVEHPDIQYHFIPGCVLGQLDFLPHHGFQIHVGTLRPTSRGTIKLGPNGQPLIDPKFLDTDEDLQNMMKAARLADEVIQQPAFKAYKGARLAPDPDMDIYKDDAALESWIRNSSHSAYHLSCTAAMGRVVDENGAVYGVDGLRVVDASIMPSMTSGNLNAPTIMLAEKIAAHITNTELEADPMACYIAPNWREAQR